MTPEVDAGAELRIVETMPEDFAVAADGTSVGWGPSVDTRLRLQAKLVLDRVRGEVEGDAFSGQLAGRTWALASIDERGRHENDALSAAGLVPRTLRVGGRTPWFDLEAGLGTSAWGLGMVANDGAGDPLFGRADFGDRSVRARIATAPFRGEGPDGRYPLFLVLAGDAVVADDLARWSEGDRALQGVAAVLLHRERQQAGLYAVYRRQTSPSSAGASEDGAETRVGVIDATADLTFEPGPIVRLAAEAAVITGHTSVARTYVAPDGVAVRQAGLAVQTSVTTSSGRLGAHLRGALASGDSASDDGRATDFRFDRDYDVGMVLFDEVQGDLDLAAFTQATDPSLAEFPPEGVETLAAEGAFHQAVALQPVAEVAPTEWLALRLGTVFAWSTAPIAQPYYTFRNGGVPTNAMDTASEGRYLGTEIDWAIGTRDAAIEDWRVRPALELEVGHAFPSVALLGEGVRVDHVLVTGFLRF